MMGWGGWRPHDGIAALVRRDTAFLSLPLPCGDTASSPEPVLDSGLPASRVLSRPVRGISSESAGRRQCKHIVTCPRLPCVKLQTRSFALPRLLFLPLLLQGLEAGLDSRPSSEVRSPSWDHVLIPELDAGGGAPAERTLLCGRERGLDGEPVSMITDSTLHLSLLLSETPLCAGDLDTEASPHFISKGVSTCGKLSKIDN